MPERQELVPILILAGVTLVCICGSLILETVGRESFAEPYTPSLPDGTLVSWSGTVSGVTPVSSGDHLILTVNGVPVFIPSPYGLQIPAVGEIVSVCGVVQTFRGKREILVEDPADVRIRQGSQERDLHF